MSSVIDKKEDFRIICGTYEKLIFGINGFWGKYNPVDEEEENNENSKTENEIINEEMDSDIENGEDETTEESTSLNMGFNNELKKAKAKVDATALALASNNLALRLDPVFIYPSHISYIKCIGIGGHHLASGGTDELIKLYDLKKRKEVGTLLHHSGTITCLTFFQKHNMISAGEDGEICLWRTKDWEKLKSFKGHKGGVTSVAIHPSGKLALSVGLDKTLRCWNLIEGKAAYTLKIYRKDALKIFWNEDGSKYAILFDQEVRVYDSMNPNDILVISHKGRINDFRFIKDKTTNKEYIITGAEDKRLRLYDLTLKKCIGVWENGTKTRIKCIDVMENNDVIMLLTCSSDGVINVWDVNGILDLIEVEEEEAEEAEEEDKKKESITTSTNIEGKTNDNEIITTSRTEKIIEDIEPISRYNTECRITCVSFAPPINYENVNQGTKKEEIENKEEQKKEEKEIHQEEIEQEKEKEEKKINNNNNVTNKNTNKKKNKNKNKKRPNNSSNNNNKKVI